METWESIARESIRDLVARYNANGDSGRFEAVRDLFVDDAVMVIEQTTYTGLDEIMTIFTGAKAAIAAPLGAPAAYVRHMTATHQIDLVSEEAAVGRCYFQVLTSVGLDHWGRYVDRYTRRDGTWKFFHRKVTVDGYSACSLFDPA
jgi:ketosteroid isomerase-like protein